MRVLISVIHILAAFLLIGLVLIQHGKGAEAGAAFGSGASNTMFGSIGSVPFLLKLTTFIAAIFFATSIMLGIMLGKAQPLKLPNAKELPILPSN